ncbi:phage tail protein [Anaeromusa acidaminophila]|uniref:phage tail protein n=1 Tax=Anaeromusa acidaminophila TaxID=81464 RepID=UPI0008FBF8A5|nr:phage tail protein [Anaeromusa acidaminophila]
MITSQGSIVSSIPVGTVIAWPSNKPPNTNTGTWFDCDGSTFSNILYPDLYNVLGTTVLPDYKNRFLQGSIIPNQILEAGLPNITGKLFYIPHMSDDIIYGQGVFSAKFTGYDGMRSSSLGLGVPFEISFDASKGNPIYGSSNTVQPPSATVRYLIKAK